MKIQLSDKFTYSKLLKFTFPTIIMMIFTSIYGVVDGIFVSNFAGKIPFASINLIMPVFMIIGSLGFMLGTGGSALVAKLLGEGKKEKANRTFSMLIYISLIGAGIISILGFIFIKPLAAMLGAKGEILECCVLYGRILIPTTFSFILQNEFQAFKSVCGFEPRSNELIKKLKRKGFRLVLATNPLFPRIATESRIKWAGLDKDDFEFITTYENIGFSKPNPLYYSDIAMRLGMKSNECLMIGNDVRDDMAALEVGMDAFLLTDGLINIKNVDITQYQNGSFSDLEAYLDTL